MDILFLIPARSGSKGLPGKNLMTVGGIPLVGRAARLAMQAATQFGPGCRVVISTDDESIAATACEWGAEAPFLRPAELATDTSATIDVILHALDALAHFEFEAVVLLQPTSPLTEVDDVIRAVELHMSTQDCVVSVCRAEHPSEWQFTINADGQLQPINTNKQVTRRQDARLTYRLNGAIYVAAPGQLRTNRTFLSPDTRAIEMPAERSVDIDFGLDLRIAEAIHSARQLRHVTIADRKISPGQPCFMIAEAGVNHNGSEELAYQLIDAAVEAGADAVKFQTFKAEKLISPVAPKADYQTASTGVKGSQLEMVKQLELPFSAFERLFSYCKQKNILFISTPFDEESADFLDQLGVLAFKISSGEITNLPFLKHIAAKGKPLIVSTGMSHLSEIETAVRAIEETGNTSLVLLHCVSNYPADPADVNLKAMQVIKAAFGVPVGFSDHTLGVEVALGAVALGACVIEKHFTLDRNLPGPDHRASSEPYELKALINGIRKIEAALGDERKRPALSEANTAAVARRSLVAAKDIAAGTTLTSDCIVARRPGTGLPPAFFHHLIGRIARIDIAAGTVLQLEMLV